MAEKYMIEVTKGIIKNRQRPIGHKRRRLGNRRSHSFPRSGRVLLMVVGITGSPTRLTATEKGWKMAGLSAGPVSLPGLSIRH
jgi:hypothetical protein